MSTYLQLQQEFADLTMDTSATWIAWWAQNKACINKAYEFLYNTIKNTEKVKKYIWLVKTKVTLTNKQWSLPAWFDVIDKVSTVDFTTDSWVDLSNMDNRYFDFVITWPVGTKKITVQDILTEVWVTYLPTRSDMSTDSDTPVVMPLELHRSIVDYAMPEYFRRIRDNQEASNSYNLASLLLLQRLKTLW